MASNGTLSPSDSMTLRDGVTTMSHSEKEERLGKPVDTTIAIQDSEKEKDNAVTEIVKVEPSFPDGGWRAWGVVLGVSLSPYHEIVLII